MVENQLLSKDSEDICEKFFSEIMLFYGLDVCIFDKDKKSVNFYIFKEEGSESIAIKKATKTLPEEIKNLDLKNLIFIMNRNEVEVYEKDSFDIFYKKEKKHEEDNDKIKKELHNFFLVEEEREIKDCNENNSQDIYKLIFTISISLYYKDYTEYTNQIIFFLSLLKKEDPRQLDSLIDFIYDNSSKKEKDPQRHTFKEKIKNIDSEIYNLLEIKGNETYFYTISEDSENIIIVKIEIKEDESKEIEIAENKSKKIFNFKILKNYFSYIINLDWNKKEVFDLELLERFDLKLLISYLVYQAKKKKRDYNFEEKECKEIQEKIEKIIENENIEELFKENKNNLIIFIILVSFLIFVIFSSILYLA